MSKLQLLSLYVMGSALITSVPLAIRKLKERKSWPPEEILPISLLRFAGVLLLLLMITEYVMFSSRDTGWANKTLPIAAIFGLFLSFVVRPGYFKRFIHWASQCRVRSWLFFLSSAACGVVVMIQYGVSLSVLMISMITTIMGFLSVFVVPIEGDSLPKNRLIFRITVFILALSGMALWLRLLYFNGIGGHDDFCYLFYLRQTFHGDYHEIFNTPHGIRLAVMLPMMAVFGLLGPSYWGAFLPVMTLSVLEVPLAYIISRKVGLSYWTSLLAAWFMAIHPLNTFVATTIRGDIEASFMSGVCLLLFLISGLFDRNRGFSRSMAIWAVILGFAIGLGVTAKPTNWAAFFVLALIFLIDSLRRGKVLYRYAWVIVGVLVFFGTQGVFYHFAVDNPLQQFGVGLMDYTKLTASGDFNNDPSLRFGFLPAMMFDLKFLQPRLMGWDNNNYAGYGIFFFMMAASFLFMWRSTYDRSAVPILWLVGFLLFLAFGTMSLSVYIPPHKEPRHLAVVTIPLVVILATVVWNAMQGVGGRKDVFHGIPQHSGLFVFLLIVSISSISNISFHHVHYREKLADSDALLEFVNSHPNANFWTHHYLMQYLELKTGYQRPNQSQGFPGSESQTGSINDTAFFEFEKSQGDFLALYRPISSYSQHPRLGHVVRKGAFEEVANLGANRDSLTIYRVLPEVEDLKTSKPGPDYLPPLRGNRIERTTLEKYIGEKFQTAKEWANRLILAWECQELDGVDDLKVRGKEIRLEHVSYREPQNIAYQFYGEISPTDKFIYHVLKDYGRGAIKIISQPDRTNNHTLTIRIDDSEFSAHDYYRFFLFAVEN